MRRFKHMLWTSHVPQPGEMRGKASNVDWAAREAHAEFCRLGECHQKCKVSDKQQQGTTPHGRHASCGAQLPVCAQALWPRDFA